MAEIAGVPEDCGSVRARGARAAGGRGQLSTGRGHRRRSSAYPWAAGLGGGSSDAATCLVALNRLWQLHWPVDDLAALGLKLGADVPVFVRGRAAWAEGVGERLTPLYPPLAPRGG